MFWVWFFLKSNSIRSGCAYRIQLRSSAAITPVVDIEQRIGIGIRYGALLLVPLTESSLGEKAIHEDMGCWLTAKEAVSGPLTLSGLE